MIYDPSRTTRRHRRARGAARRRPSARPAIASRRNGCARTACRRKGSSFVAVGRSPRHRHRAAVERLGRQRQAALCCSARSRSAEDCRSQGLGAAPGAPRDPGRAQARPWRDRAGRRPGLLRAASASRPKRPARCGCRARSNAAACSAANSMAGALDGARGADRRRPAGWRRCPISPRWWRRRPAPQPPCAPRAASAAVTGRQRWQPADHELFGRRARVFRAASLPFVTLGGYDRPDFLDGVIRR